MRIKTSCNICKRRIDEQQQQQQQQKKTKKEKDEEKEKGTSMKELRGTKSEWKKKKIVRLEEEETENT